MARYVDRDIGSTRQRHLLGVLEHPRTSVIGGERQRDELSRLSRREAPKTKPECQSILEGCLKRACITTKAPDNSECAEI